MAKLTKTQRRQLGVVRGNLSQGVEYLRRPDIVGIAVEIDPQRANGGDYTRNNHRPEAEAELGPLCVRTINHQIGSHVVGIYRALNMLQEFLADD